MSRMFGGDTKVSLHSSGECQFSGTSAWVLKGPGRRNADRHFFKWKHQRPFGAAALDALQIRIPYSELRAVNNQEDLREVVWLSAPARGNLAGIECYITPPTVVDPAVTGCLPGRHLSSIKLTDDRWAIIICFEEPYDQRALEATKKQVRDLAAREGHTPNANHRGCAILAGHPTAVALLELCPLSGDSSTEDATSAVGADMTLEQKNAYNSVVSMYESYHTGVTWWQIIDYLSGLGSLFCGLVAAALAKISADHNDWVALLALIAAILTGIQKQLTPRHRLRMDWKGHSNMFQLRADLDADRNFDPKVAVARVNKIVKSHDSRFIP